MAQLIIVYLLLVGACVLTIVQEILGRRRVVVRDAFSSTPEAHPSSSMSLDEKVQYLIDWLHQEQQHGRVQIVVAPPNRLARFMSNLGWNFVSIVIGWSLNAIFTHVILFHS